MERQTITSAEFKERLLLTDEMVRSKKVRYENSAILIEHLTVEGEVKIDALKLAGRSVIITDVHFSGSCRCNHAEMERVHFIACQFKLLGFIGSHAPATVQDCTIETLVLESSRAKTELLVQCKANHIKVYNTNLNAEMSTALRPLTSLSLKECDLHGVTLRSHGEDRSHTLRELDINDCSISGDLKLFDLKVDWLRIRDMFFNQSFLFLEHCTISHLHIEDLDVREAEVTFKSVAIAPSKDGALTDDSRVDKSASIKFAGLRTQELVWSLCDWSRTKMYVADNFIQKVATKGSTTPRHILPLHGNWKEVVDLYGLLEAQARSQGHTADAITNRSGGLKAYRTYLQKPKRDRMDRFTLWLSEQISDYGSNWFRALAVLTLSGLTIFLSIVLPFDDRVVLGVDSTTGEVLLQYAGYFFDFLSPIHAQNFMDMDLSGWPKVIDALSRVWLGFVIYHVIRSTRKFVN
ncbi:MAG: hypothetical protein IPJ76_09730 [Flavobacteriales bacterium]|nr:MAG: hypothetical protein IPJ76_09730 [Flavobacteriales bacterium]